eukprot:6116980-Pyramimonas_sp.AAC.1
MSADWAVLCPEAYPLDGSPTPVPRAALDTASEIDWPGSGRNYLPKVSSLSACGGQEEGGKKATD